MIILDLSNYKGKPPDFWPVNIPDKIRLIKGKYQKEYDIHSSERQKKWYKKLFEFHKAKFSSPPYRNDWPMGMNKSELPNGVKITET